MIGFRPCFHLDKVYTSANSTRRKTMAGKKPVSVPKGSANKPKLAPPTKAERKLAKAKIKVTW
jgi:hypothetical protein